MSCAGLSSPMPKIRTHWSEKTVPNHSSANATGPSGASFAVCSSKQAAQKEGASASHRLSTMGQGHKAATHSSNLPSPSKPSKSQRLIIHWWRFGIRTPESSSVITCVRMAAGVAMRSLGSCNAMAASAASMREFNISCSAEPGSALLDRRFTFFSGAERAFPTYGIEEPVAAK